jgi:hypothetical protein
MMNKNFTLCVLCLIIGLSSRAQKLVNSTLSAGGATQMLNGRYFSHVIGQTSVAGTYQNGNLSVRQGFKQPGIGVINKTQPINYISTTKQPQEPIITFTAYPNPFYDHVKISFSDVVVSQTQISLFDISGNKIIENTLTSMIKEIEIPNLVNLRAGQYILHVTQNGSPTTLILIKEL